jgi:hypothetical protein
MKILFYKFLGLFGIHRQTDLQMLRNNLVHMRHEYETRIQHLEGDVRRLCTMLGHDQVNVTTDATVLKDHFQTVVREAVEDSFDFDTLVSEAINEHDFSDSISDALDDAISNRDWDYELREAIDWDKVAEKAVEKMDWSDIISDNDIVTTNDIDLDDVMLQSEHMSDDDVMTRSDLSDEVCSELKRDWFKQMLSEQVASIFKDTLYKARETEHDNVINAIDDEIANGLAKAIEERMAEKFGTMWDTWYVEHTRHCVKTILGEFLASAYEQTKEDNNSAQ